MIQEFKDFIFRGNALALAIGVMVAGAFQKVVDAVVTWLLNPIIGAILGGLDLSKSLGISLSPGKTAFSEGSATIGIGPIVGSIITFLITMLVLFVIAKSAAKDALKK
jgi:large conductance mechanosensitive channel